MCKSTRALVFRDGRYQKTHLSIAHSGACARRSWKNRCEGWLNLHLIWIFWGMAWYTRICMIFSAMTGFRLVQHGWAAHFYHFLSQIRLALKVRNSGGFSVTNADGSLVGPWNAMVYSPLIGGLAERMGSFCRHQNACAPDAWASLVAVDTAAISGGVSWFRRF